MTDESKPQFVEVWEIYNRCPECRTFSIWRRVDGGDPELLYPCEHEGRKIYGDKYHVPRYPFGVPEKTDLVGIKQLP